MPFSVVLTVLTVTVQESEKFVSRLAVAVMVQTPSATPVTTPSSFTVATEASEVDHVTVRSVAVHGVTVAESLPVEPDSSSSVSREISTPSTVSTGSIQSPPPLFLGIIRQVRLSQRSTMRLYSPVSGLISK